MYNFGIFAQNLLVAFHMTLNDALLAPVSVYKSVIFILLVPIAIEL
jgi:hypothetical protein